MSGKTSWTGHVCPPFHPGQTVEAHPRVADTLESAPHTKPEATAKVTDQGEVTFTGLLANGPYFCYGKVKVRREDPNQPDTVLHRAVSFTANPEDQLPSLDERVRPAATRQQALAEAEARDTFAQRFPETASPAPGRTIVTGARNTFNTQLGTHQQQTPDSFEAKVDEPQPHPKQEQVKGPQRSSTPAGQATPVEPGELQPRPSQSDIKPGTPQRSDTPLGEATPKDPAEAVPGARQEESGKKKQRSDTPHGTQEPKPSTQSPKRQETARESSESKAKGSGTTAKAGTEKKQKGASKSRSASKAKKAQDPIKPASKRQAKKQDS